MSLSTTFERRADITETPTPRDDSQKSRHAVCIHCGTPFASGKKSTGFCCSGCEFVFNLIQKNGLNRFYDLRDAALPPVKPFVFRRRDYAWLNELAEKSDAAREGSLTLDLHGISCIGCVWLIEKLFLRKSGALAVEVDSTLGHIELRWQSGLCDVVGFAHELQSFGYLVGPLGKNNASGARLLVKRIGVCAAFALNAMLFSIPRYLGMDAHFQFAGLFDRLALLFATLSFLVGGTYFFQRSWTSLRNGVLHIDLPISIGLIAAYAGSICAWSRGAMNFAYFDFVSMFTFLMLAGRWLQQTAVEKNRNRLLDEQHGAITVIRCGEKISAAELQRGERFEVLPGQVVPVRAKLTSSAASLGLEWINGESEARAARIGQVVSSGAINCGQHVIELEAIEDWPHSTLFSLVQSAPRNTHACAAAQRFIKGYILVVIAIAVAGFVAWLLTGHSFLVALQVLISVLVVSCPCASGVALPLADELAAASLRDAGVFVREQSLWARLARIRKIIFDKTGTLTLETMSLKDPSALDALAPEQKRVLLRMVQDNLHPVSCCLRELLMAAGVEAAGGGEVAETVGCGLELRAEGNVWRLGKPEWAADAAADESVFSLNGKALAGFSFCEQVRTDATEEVARLQARGNRVHILSGDRNLKVAAMASQLRLDPAQSHGEMSPADKAAWVRAHDARDTLFIGDGANDSLAFNESFCTGTPAIDRGLLENKADFYFLGRGLNGVRRLLDVARSRRNAARGVVGFALAYNCAVIAISLAGKMSPLAASVLMPCSSLVSLAIVFSISRGGFCRRSAGFQS